jgi:hypothetical protein
LAKHQRVHGPRSAKRKRRNDMKGARAMTHRFASQTPGFRRKRALEQPMH